MTQVDINFMAVLVSSLINMVLGFIWYGPLFGKPWMELTGISQDKIAESKAKGMNMTYDLSGIGALVMAFVLANITGYAQVDTLVEGVQVGFLVWLGFVVTTMLNSVIYDGKPWRLYFINAGYYLVSLVLMGALLAVWR